MKSTKETTHTFIVRIWIEPRELKNAEPIWRGVIEEVNGQKSMYFDNLDKIRAYFSQCLDELGIKVDNPSK